MAAGALVGGPPFRHLPLTPSTAAPLPGPDWLRARRAQAYERFAATPMPTDAEEVWRYSRIAELELDRFAAAPSPEGDGVPASLDTVLDSLGERAGLLVVRNGSVVRRELDP